MKNIKKLITLLRLLPKIGSRIPHIKTTGPVNDLAQFSVSRNRGSDGCLGLLGTIRANINDPHFEALRILRYLFYGNN